MLRRVLPLVCLVVLALPPAALAQSDNPFGPLQLPPVQTTPPEVPSSTTNSDGGGLKSWQEILIIFAGGVLVIGIGWAIVADARSVAPRKEETEISSQAKARKEIELKRRKAQARAANRRSRAARKRNR
jgi:hypothetical protein